MLKSPDATCFMAFESFTTGLSRIMLMTTDIVMPMMMLKIISHRISGTSMTRLRIILESQLSRPAMISVPNISTRETMINSSRILRSLSCFGCAGLCFIA